MYINTYKHEKTHETLGFVEFQQNKTPEIVRRKPTVIVIIIMLSIKNAFS